MEKAMKRFDGKVLFLDRSDINTDEIIPARYLSEVSKRALKPHLLEDLQLNGTRFKETIEEKGVIITRSNFGCGSSREHAVWALETNGIHLVVAQGFARIFKQNMFNCGLLAVTLPENRIDHIFEMFSGLDTTLETDLEARRLVLSAEGAEAAFEFHLSEFELTLVMAGGWVAYADQTY